MSQRAHMWIRLVALAIIVAISCIPRGDRTTDTAGQDGRHAEVARK